MELSVESLVDQLKGYFPEMGASLDCLKEYRKKDYNKENVDETINNLKQIESVIDESKICETDKKAAKYYFASLFKTVCERDCIFNELIVTRDEKDKYMKGFEFYKEKYEESVKIMNEYKNTNKIPEKYKFDNKQIRIRSTNRLTDKERAEIATGFKNVNFSDESFKRIPRKKLEELTGISNDSIKSITVKNVGKSTVPGLVDVKNIVNKRK